MLRMGDETSSSINGARVNIKSDVDRNHRQDNNFKVLDSQTGQLGNRTLMRVVRSAHLGPYHTQAATFPLVDLDGVRTIFYSQSL